MVCAVRVRANPDKYVMAYGWAKVLSNLGDVFAQARTHAEVLFRENFLIQLCRPDPFPFLYAGLNTRLPPSPHTSPRLMPKLYENILMQLCRPEPYPASRIW